MLSSFRVCTLEPSLQTRPVRGEGGAPVVVSGPCIGAVYPCIRRVSPCIGRKQRVSTQLRVFPVYWSQTRLRAVGRRRTASSTHLPRAQIHCPRPNACTGMLRSEAACTIGQIACIWSHSTSVIVAELIVVVVVTSCKDRQRRCIVLHVDGGHHAPLPHDVPGGCTTLLLERSVRMGPVGPHDGRVQSGDQELRSGPIARLGLL